MIVINKVYCPICGHIDFEYQFGSNEIHPHRCPECGSYPAIEVENIIND